MLRFTLSRFTLTCALSPTNASPPSCLIRAVSPLRLTLPPLIGNRSPPLTASAGAIGRMPMPRGSRSSKMFGSRTSVVCPRLIGTASAGEAPAATSAIVARTAIAASARDRPPLARTFMLVPPPDQVARHAGRHGDNRTSALARLAVALALLVVSFALFYVGLGGRG